MLCRVRELFGAGIWPFAISIIVFSLVIDKIGYRAAMIFSFICYAVYAALALICPRNRDSRGPWKELHSLTRKRRD